MNSSASWTAGGLSPELYQAAREAAHRAGMSVEDWLRSTFGDSAVSSMRPQGAGPLGARLGELSQRFGHGAETEAAPMSPRGARLTDTVAKLNARLEQMSTGRPAPAASATMAGAPPAPKPESSELGIDQVIAEIEARQRALDGATAAPAPAAAPARVAAAEPAQMAAPDFSRLEQQLQHITKQIESLRQPSGVEDAIVALRSDLAEVARAVQEALPRRTLENLQGDVNLLAERINRGYGRGADPSQLETIERSLAEVHERLNAMTPAESLAGFDARISELSRKMDSVSAGSPDPETLRYLEAAITELRELSAGVASAEGVASLAGDVQALSARIDHIAERTGTTGLDSLAHRVNELTQALDTRVEQISPLPQNIEALVQALSDKLNHSDSAARDQVAFEHVERQILQIAEKLDAAEHKSGDLRGIERGIQQLTLQVREAREEAIATAERVARKVAADMADAIPTGGADVTALKRDLESLHVTHVESEQRTHETLEAVHGTLERLVERLASIETGAHAAPQGYAPQQYDAPAQAHLPQAYAPPVQPVEPAPMPELRARDPIAAPEPAPQVPARATPFVHVQRTERPPIDPDLPADTPLEPGSAGRGRSPAERIAASEAALAPLKREPAPEITGKANFIAAARRAAQAAASEGAAVEGPRSEERAGHETPTGLIGRFLADRRRALIVGVSLLLVLYGAIQLAGMFGSDRGAERPAPTSGQVQPEPRKLAEPAQPPALPAAPAPTAVAAEPAAPPPAPPRQTATEPLVAPTPTPSLMAPPRPAEATSSIPGPLNIAAPTQATTPSAAQPANALPAGIGGPALRAAAAAGNPAAEFEIGMRYSEGRGVPANLELAVQWFERAADKGLAPALYRLGSLYEKGLGVKKDLEKARQLYITGADKGNAKAIHNLAVLYAEGIDGKPDYRTAAQWFRKAADKGVADSQYNLGILYARGIGVDQNLAESYKWFALAAQQGDQDAGKKREDVASRLDQQSLVAAKLAVQTWAADPPPDEAMNVKAPPGGWDNATAAAPAKPTATARRKPHSI
jgi:localization factor PodJL